MDLRWMILPVVLLCAGAEDLIEVAPGQNATLTCSANATSVYWYIEVRSQVKGQLARTFSGKPTSSVLTTLENKYMAMGQQLVISNITAEDYRLYFCARRTNGTLLVTDTFHLVPKVAITSLTNHSEGNQQQGFCRGCHSELIVYSSLALNVVLVIIGLVLTSLCLKRKICNHQVNDPSPLTSGNPETLETPQYEEIQLRAPPPAAPHSMECVYHKVQLPGSPLPRHH